MNRTSEYLMRLVLPTTVSSVASCSGLNPGLPKDVYAKPMTVTLFEKRVLADVIEIRISRRDHPGLGRALNPMTSSLIREGHKETHREEDYVKKELEIIVIQPKNAKDCCQLPEVRRGVWN